MIPNLLFILIGEDSAVGSLLKKGVFFLISLSIISIPLTFLKPKYFSYLTILLFPVVIFEASHILQFKTASSQELVASILLTNYNEVKETVLLNFLSVLTLISIFALILIISKKIKPSFLISKKTKKSILLVFVFTFIALGIRNTKLAFTFNNKSSEIIRAVNYSFKVQMTKNFPVGFFIKSYEVHKGLQKKKKYFKNTKNFTFNAKKMDSLTEDEIYVLVIGETARKHNFHVYGYPKNTTPNLDTIKNLLVYKDVKSNANVTSLSIPFMLTRATPENPEIKFNEPNIVKAYKEAGFSTYWISNQQIGIGSIFGLYSKITDTYINTSKPLDAAGFDENILPVLDNVLKDKNKKKFIIIHTVGSHFRYNYRYPEKYTVFSPTLEKGLSIESTSDFNNRIKTINSYDNSILYTDFILGEIIQKIKNKKANSFMYYISDHGENLFDTDDKKLLHGFENPSKYETEIPLLIWTSDKYNKNFTKKYNFLKKNTTNKIATTNTFFTLLNMSNITYPNFEKQKSFANKKFDSLQKRTFYSVNKSIIKID
ncbi:phosphoethanolamine transferase [Polaribacter pectinis]|uniref:Phosphoethanolamine transferase n=1 Tax=Polaribacter pectinis TaxID=2738844 RepID=A0A7G9LBV4_9FLAO|nr:phosphoethanolamine transferase [Polaribacter pectinis]QNM86103.1 phosphoethanolamine transferase [Polaribacter pectinis]